MTLNQAMRASATGLTAERFRMDVIAGNIANANSISANGTEAYRRRMVHLETDEFGVRIAKVLEDQTPLRKVHEPGSPHANEEGYVFYSNVEPVVEMVNMMTATRAYEANIAAFNASRGMVRAAMTIGKL